jgi:hypothetical protein
VFRQCPFAAVQLGLSVFAIALVRFKLHGSISNDSSSGDVCLLAPPQFWAEACTYGEGPCVVLGRGGGMHRFVFQ